MSVFHLRCEWSLNAALASGDELGGLRRKTLLSACGRLKLLRRICIKQLDVDKSGTVQCVIASVGLEKRTGRE